MDLNLFPVVLFCWNLTHDLMGDPGPDKKYTAADVLALFEQGSNPHEPYTATEAAEKIGCSRATAYNLLTELADEGTLNSKKVGASARVWWLPSTRQSNDD